MSLSTPVRLLVIADDLTGAVDSAAMAFLPGRRLAVPWHDGEPDWEQADALEPDVLCVSTDSRMLSPDEAAARVIRAVRWSHGRGFRLVKKVDSLLRGNVAAEIEAFLDAVDATSALFAPALPAQGRITIAGTQLVDGVPVSSSPAGADPHSPARQSYLSALLPAGVRSYPLRINAVRKFDLERLLRGAAGGVVVADAAEQADLDRLRDAALAVPDVVLIGTSGLLATPDVMPAPTLDGPILVVSASRRPEVADQCRALVSADPTCVELVAKPVDLLADPHLIARWHTDSSDPRPSHVTVLRVDPDDRMAASASQRRADSARLLSILADYVGDWLQTRAVPEQHTPTVVVLGGDLSAAVCDALGVRALDVVGVACGGGGMCIPVIPEQAPCVRLVLRSGAFGSVHDLAHACAS